MADQVLEGGFEVVIVQDGGGSDLEARVKEFIVAHPSLCVQFYRQEAEGPARARNRGAAAARGRVLVFTDDDCAPPSHWLGQLTALFREGGEFFVAGGPERALPGGSATGRAVNILLTSFWTTLGVNGGRWRLLPFYPRSIHQSISDQSG